MGAIVREEEGRRPAGGGRGGKGEGIRQREWSGTEAWGQLIPSHVGPPSQVRFACVADFLLRQCPLTSSSPHFPQKKAVPCPLNQLGLAPGGMDIGLAELGQGHHSLFILASLSLPSTLHPHLAWRQPLTKLYALNVGACVGPILGEPGYCCSDIPSC